MMSRNKIKMAEITDSLPGIAPVLPLPTAPLSALTVTNPVVSYGNDTRPSEASGVAADSTLDEVLETPFLLFKTNISNTDIVGDPMWLAIDPFRLFISSPLVQARCVGKRFLRGTLVITANMVVPGSAIGAYNLQALCTGGLRVNAAEEVDGISQDTIWSSFQDTFAIMNVEMQNSVTLELPFEYPVNGLEVVSGVTIDAMLWRIQLYCMSPLQSTITTTASGTINVYAHFKPDHKTMVKKYQSARFPVPRKQPGPVSSISSKLGTAASTISTMIPSIAPYAAPVAVGFKALASVADIFGFTRDADPKVPDPFVPRLTSNMVVIDGPDISEPLGMSTTNAVTVDSSLTGGDSSDAMSYSSLFSRWSLTDTITITSSTVGKITARSCSPFKGNLHNGLAHFPVAGYVGLPFNYWSGSLEYLVYIPSHQNIKGMLQVFWSAQNPALPNDPTPYLSGTMIDLSGTSATLLRVDMAPKCPSRKVVPFTTDTSTTPVDDTNGYLVFYMPNVMTSPKATQTLTVLVFTRGCSNMRFHTPRTVAAYGSGPGYYPMTGFARYESKPINYGDDNVDPNVSLQPSTTLCSGTDYPVIALNYGEEVASVRALIQKFSYVGTANLGLGTLTTDAPAFCLVSFPPPVGQSGSTTIPRSIKPVLANDQGLDPFLLTTPFIVSPWTYSAHYLAMFNGYRGSFRVKIIPRITSNSAVAQDLPPMSLGFAAVSSPEAATLAQQLGGAGWGFREGPASSNVQYMAYRPGEMCPEVHVPFGSPLPLVPAQSKLARLNSNFVGDVTGLLTNMSCMITFRTRDVYGGTTGRNVTFDVHTAAGPDCTVGHFYRTPGVRISGI
jgi:hypothetical protein